MVRLLRRCPLTVTALTVLVIGIGSTAIFSIAYAVLLRPLPYPTHSAWSSGGIQRAGIAAELRRLRQRATSFDIAFTDRCRDRHQRATPATARSRSVTVNFLGRV
jgi:hypothetical protein